jgi:hypothetical protein
LFLAQNARKFIRLEFVTIEAESVADGQNAETIGLAFSQQSRGNMGLIVTQGIWFSFTIEARQNELVAGVVQSLEYQMESYSVV